MGAPLPFRRRPQMSELMRSESCQSGPCSSSSTFLPARVSTAANTAPAAPAPTTTASTFSSAAISPAPLGQNVGHVRNSQTREALHGAVDHVDRIVAQGAVHEGLRRSLPALDLVLTQAIDEVVLLAAVELSKAALVQRPAGAVDPAQRRAIEIHVGRAHLGDPQAQERVSGRHRELLIDEMGDAVLACPDRQRLTQRFQDRRLLRLEHAKRHALGARLPRSEENLGTPYREDQGAQRRGPDEVASRNLCHWGPPFPRLIIPLLDRNGADWVGRRAGSRVSAPVIATPGAAASVMEPSDLR